MELDKRMLQFAGRLHDIVAAWVSFYLAYAVAVDFDRLFRVPGIHDKALLFAVVALICFHAVSLNRGTWRYASIPDLMAILRGAALAVVVFTLILFFLSRGENLPRSVPPLTFVFTVFFLSGSRLGYRLLREAGLFNGRNSKRSKLRNQRIAILHGANNNAESFIRAVRRSDSPALNVVGLVDDRHDPSVKFQGMRVLGKTSELNAIAARLAAKGTHVSEVVVTDVSLSKEKVAEIVSAATQAGIKVTRIPDLTDTAQMSEAALSPRRIEISDLLGRAEVVVDTSPVAKLIQDKVVFITGAGGSIGSELARQVVRFSPKLLILADISEFLLYSIDTELREASPSTEIIAKIADIREKGRIEALFDAYKPDVVFHAAALKHVPLMEENVVESVKTNVIGTKNLADAAVRHGVSTFVMISTDKAVNPTNVMGTTKRAAEAYCQSLDISSSTTRFKTVRFGNVLGSNGSVVPRFEAQIAKGGPVTVTHPEIIRYFMTIPEAVRLVLQASGHGLRRDEDRGRILVLDMGEPVRIADLARKMIELAGFRPDIDIKISYTGLRPGEKLYEELLAPEEQSGVTSRAGYMLASPRIIESGTINKAFGNIEKAVAESNEAAAFNWVCHIVPEYQPTGQEIGNVIRLARRKEQEKPESKAN